MRVMTGQSSVDSLIDQIIKESPSGSEGGLRFHNLTEGDGKLNSDNLMFYGDLRDFGNDDIPKIKAWVELIHELLDKKAIIRQLDICCNVENNKERIYFVNQEKEE